MVLHSSLIARLRAARPQDLSIAEVQGLLHEAASALETAQSKRHLGGARYGGIVTATLIRGTDTV